MPKSPYIPNYTFKSMVIYCVGALIPSGVARGGICPPSENPSSS